MPTRSAPFPSSSSRPGSTRSRSTRPIAATPGSRCSPTARSATSRSRCRRSRPPKFVAVVQERVEEFLTDCATQEVLQPTACPFGYLVEDRIASPPQWSIAQQPTVAVVPDGAAWTHPARRGGRPHRGRHPLALRRLDPPRQRGRPVPRHRRHHGAARRQRHDHGRRPRHATERMPRRPRRPAHDAAAPYPP